MIICSVCNQGIAIRRAAGEVPMHQRAAYVRHLKGAHKIEAASARRMARNAQLLTVDLPPLLTAEERWEKARRMWAEDEKVVDIAKEYGVTEKGMRARIRRWRKSKGWFPLRTNAA